MSATATQTLGVEFQLKGLKDVLNAFVAVRREQAATTRDIDKSMANLSKVAGRVAAGGGSRGGRSSGGGRRPAGPKSFSDRLNDMMYSSRFGAGTGPMPLAGKVVDLIGGKNSPLGRGLLGIGFLGGAAIEVGKTFLTLVKVGNDFALDMNKMSTTTGGTQGETSRLLGWANLLGPGNTGTATSATMNLQKAMTGGGMGQVYAAKFGLANLTDSFGNQDYAGYELKLLPQLRQMWQNDKSKGHGSSLRAIRSLGQQDMIPAFRADNTAFNNSMRIAKGAGGNSQGAIAFGSAEANAQTAWAKFLNSFLGPSGATAAVQKFADVLNSIADPKSPGDKIMRAAVQPWWMTLGDTIKDYKGLAHNLANKDPNLKNALHVMGAPSFAAASPHARAAYEAHLKEMRKSTNASSGIADIIRDAVRGGGVAGSYGNMTRSNPMPSQIDTGFVLNRYLSLKALHLSSF